MEPFDKSATLGRGTCRKRTSLVSLPKTRLSNGQGTAYVTMEVRYFSSQLTVPMVFTEFGNTEISCSTNEVTNKYVCPSRISCARK